MLKDMVFLLFAFVMLWAGAGFSIDGVEKVSKRIKISSFIISFFALGVLTSTSEISVAYFSILDKTPSISVGNLIGASTMLILLVIPLLAILNKGIRFDERSEPINFPLAYLVISLPVLLILDKTLNLIDGVILISSFVFLAITISKKNALINKIEEALNHHNINILKELSKILMGILLIVFSCKFIVDIAVVYANKFSIPPFMIGVIVLSIGTNLPELTVLVKSTLLKKKIIALGDYVGSAVVNTVTLGFLALFYKLPIKIEEGIKYNLLLLPIGTILFIFFTKNKKLERNEGIILLLLYLLFVFMEFAS